MVFSQHHPRYTGLYFTGMANQVHFNLPDDHKYKRTWTFNKAYTVTKGHKYFDQETGVLDFGTYTDNMKKRRSLRYDTVFGWAFAHSGIIYANSDNNISEGLARHHKVKLMESSSDQDEVGNLTSLIPEVLAADGFCFETALRDNQKKYCEAYGDEFVSAVKRELGEHFYAYTIAEASYLLTLEKHKKQKLRADGYSDIELEGLLRKYTYMLRCEWKLKIEIAKYNKPPRIIVDESVVGSLPRVHFANSWKRWTKDRVVNFGCVSVCYMGSSDYKSVLAIFEKLQWYTDKIEIVNNSDDAIIHWSASGLHYIYNLDLASNDSSHSFHTFSLYSRYSNMPYDQKRNLFETLRMPIRIFNHDKTRHIEMRTEEGYMPSGIGDTTCGNNGAWKLIAYSLQQLLDAGHTMSIALVTLASFRVGFRVSYQKVEKLGDAQFLKQSPFLLEGKLCHSLNLGVILRFSGRTKGDMPDIPYPEYAVTKRAKAAYLQTLLTYGFFKYNRYGPVQTRLCPFFEEVNKSEKKHAKVLDEYGHRILREQIESFSNPTDRPILYHTTESFYSRYNLALTDIAEFESLLEGLDFGLTIWCKLVDIVLKADYGLKW